MNIQGISERLLLKEKNSLLFLGKILLSVMIIVFSYYRAKKETAFEDFHVFWQAGIHLWNSVSLYETGPGLKFIYPPFSALFFSIYSIFPFKMAVFFMFLTNFFLWGVSFFLLKKIFLIYEKQDKKVQYALIISFLLSFKFFWNNIMMVQSNAIVYVFLFTGYSKLPQEQRK